MKIVQVNYMVINVNDTKLYTAKSEHGHYCTIHAQFYLWPHTVEMPVIKFCNVSKWSTPTNV
jgi:hypothetical protein